MVTKFCASQEPIHRPVDCHLVYLHLYYMQKVPVSGPKQVEVTTRKHTLFRF